MRNVINFTISCWQEVILHMLFTPHLARFPGISEASCRNQNVTSTVDNFFTLYNGRVLSSTNAPGIALLQERLNPCSKGCRKRMMAAISLGCKSSVDYQRVIHSLPARSTSAALDMQHI